MPMDRPTQTNKAKARARNKSSKAGPEGTQAMSSAAPEVKPMEAMQSEPARVPLDAQVSASAGTLAREGLGIVSELQDRFKTLESWHATTLTQIHAAQTTLAERDAALLMRERELAALQEAATTDAAQAQALKEQLTQDRATFEKYRAAEERVLAERAERAQRDIEQARVAFEEELLEVRRQSAQSLLADRELAERAMLHERELSLKQIERDKQEAQRVIERAQSELASARRSLAESQAALDDDRTSLGKLREKLDEEWDSVSRLRVATDGLMKAWDHELDRVTGRALRLVNASDAGMDAAAA